MKGWLIKLDDKIYVGNELTRFLMGTIFSSYTVSVQTMVYHRISPSVNGCRYRGMFVDCTHIIVSLL